MGNLLTSIGEVLTAINFAALLLILALKQKRTAFEVIVFITMLLSIGHLTIEYKLHKMGVNGGDVGFIRAAWYLGFSSTYLIHIVVCTLYCNAKNLVRDKSSTIILISFFIAAILQVLRYIDRLILETNVLGPLYTNGIPAINSICTIVIVMYVASKYLTNGEVGLYLRKFKLTSPLIRGATRWIK
ncbi:hypothetical protein [Paraglaciecola psychrophila]|jgi:hypothetical protein|uniref:hypothetical protein n=1 Tax=Paraglaciecola psychrophila TaxID=326544 RepID=UPI00055811EA|nr:hypothetical protein [Paraglaciecola psychrophila]